MTDKEKMFLAEFNKFIDNYKINLRKVSMEENENSPYIQALSDAIDNFREYFSQNLKQTDDVYYKIPRKNKNQIIGIFYFHKTGDVFIFDLESSGHIGAIYGNFDYKSKTFNNVDFLSLYYATHKEGVIEQYKNGRIGLSEIYPSDLMSGRKKAFLMQLLFEQFHFKEFSENKNFTDEAKIFDSIYNAYNVLKNKKFKNVILEEKDEFISIKAFDIEKKNITDEYIVFYNGKKFNFGEEKMKSYGAIQLEKSKSVEGSHILVRDNGYSTQKKMHKL